MLANTIPCRRFANIWFHLLASVIRSYPRKHSIWQSVCCPRKHGIWGQMPLVRESLKPYEPHLKRSENFRICRMGKLSISYLWIDLRAAQKRKKTLDNHGGVIMIVKRSFPWRATDAVWNHRQFTYLSVWIYKISESFWNRFLSPSILIIRDRSETICHVFRTSIDAQERNNRQKLSIFHSFLQRNELIRLSPDNFENLRSNLVTPP